MVATRTRMTVDEILRMPDDGYRYELVRGVVVRREPGGLLHGAVAGEIAAPLYMFAKANRLGGVYGVKKGFQVFPGEDTVYFPTMAFVRADVLATVENYDDIGRFAPDLAVDLVMPGEQVEDFADRVYDYLAAGVRLVWIVEPLRRAITVFAPGTQPREFGEADILDGGGVLPGFRLPVAEIFELG